MLPPELQSAPEVIRAVAARVRVARLQRAWPQAELAARSGMSLGSLRRFERTGLISFEALVRVAFALDALDGFAALFPSRPSRLDDLLDAPVRKRGRRQVRRPAAGAGERP